MKNLDLYGEVIDEPTKICNKCNESLPLSSFGKDSGANKLKSCCKQCDSKLSYDRRLAHKSAPSVESDHVCPICEQSAEDLENSIQTTIRKSYSPWAMDHDHETKQFRGWLCRKCNIALGNFCDSIELLEKAIEYLKLHKS